MKTIKEADFRDKVILVRVDFNVPLKNGTIEDDERIRAALPTIKFILKKNPRQLILISHLGRPDGRVVENLRLNNVAKRLEQLLKRRVLKLDDCIGIKIPENAKLVLLENLRFHPEEELDDELFARKIAIASNADIYVNEAFSVSHRAHASVHAITKLLPSYAGFELVKELTHLDIRNAKHPIVVLMGGAKVGDKIGLIETMLKKADVVLIGGAMAFTFLKSLGLNIGKSKVENEKIGLAKNILKNSKNRLILPPDVLVADKIDENANISNKGIGQIGENEIGVDIGEETISIFKEVLNNAKTVLWNGPLGIFEIKRFAHGTEEIARHIAGLTKKGVKTIAGGGDTIAVLDKLGIKNEFSHVSTGGGASLEFLEGKKLPGIEALK